MAVWVFDGTLTGLCSCIFRAFQFREFTVQITANNQAQFDLLGENIYVTANEHHAQRVWQGLQHKLSKQALQQLHYAFLSEKNQAYQHIFNYCIYVFQQQQSVEKNYGQADILAISQWAKQVGREKHRMEAFIRFKKTKEQFYVALIRPDFNVIPIIQRHFKQRYQDQKWLIYDDLRHYGIFYDLDNIHQIEMNTQHIDSNLDNGFQQQFMIALDDDEILYDQLWKDYFHSVNVKERQNLKLHIQYVPKRYWRYLNEKWPT
ncbi:DNA metabolism protein [Acinetobacter qingfengensis]|uniref:DNA metabolism protein n=1 Tax=Acinetobacter qingfengensis TaxID=1262585 RepID=A0A1E7RCH0_9GAMM|nr:TIGR03915 family putative DNA repair protein [Acinetobacter qingfengensis]KAA8735248.1 DNA metabolism protein [Acinetobacter qingfengensis]OEY96976.1 DNA metabolism protein [Acinetobacter qingfengensis]